ncbi:MAG: ABC transporter permease, partial [Rhodobacteraceae bacterium]|nr:ABC transporter permease [Paracoccaceae bacterium]
MAKSLPTPRRHAHTASGREVLGFWGWFERVVLFITFASIALGAWAFWIDYGDRVQARLVNKKTLEAYVEQTGINQATLSEIAEARADREADAITRAWTLITTPAPGNSGKGSALEYLNGLGIPLTGIDLSCETIGGGWDETADRQGESVVVLDHATNLKLFGGDDSVGRTVRIEDRGFTVVG